MISDLGNAHCNAPDQRQFSSHLVGALGCRSQFTYICAGLSPLLNVESNRSWCWQSLIYYQHWGEAQLQLFQQNVTTIVAVIPPFLVAIMAVVFPLSSCHILYSFCFVLDCKTVSFFTRFSVVLSLRYRCMTRECVTHEPTEATQYQKKKRLSLFHTTNSFRPEWVSFRSTQRICNVMSPQSGGTFSRSFDCIFQQNRDDSTESMAYPWIRISRSFLEAYRRTEQGKRRLLLIIMKISNAAGKRVNKERL